jgi:hypothetical protein
MVVSPFCRFDEVKMLKMQSMRLSRKLPLFVTGVCALMAVALSSLTYVNIRASTIAEQEVALQVLLKGRSENMRDWIGDVATVTLLLAHNPAMIDAMVGFQTGWARIEGHA